MILFTVCGLPILTVSVCSLGLQGSGKRDREDFFFLVELKAPWFQGSRVSLKALGVNSGDLFLK